MPGTNIDSATTRCTQQCMWSRLGTRYKVSTHLSARCVMPGTDTASEGLAIKYETSVSILKKRNKLYTSDIFPGKELLVPASSPPPSRTSSVASEHEEDVYDSMPGTSNSAIFL
eukprot:974088-Rhodomonas_salina.3